ncbi:MAG: chalcone isomerase family protein, partial [Acetobacteraceae bacterium]|nr:chalcone isomerase family protein [Acetobacteraceae bacterium]
GGLSLPDSITVAGRQLVLNGIGLRTYSILGVRIYVAGLYLQQRSSDPAAILRSPEIKLLDFRFLREVEANDARRSWQQGLQNNCRPPCHLPPQEVAEFLAAVPSVHRGDRGTLLFTPGRLDVAFNGQPFGTVTDPLFVQVVLATFIGPVPSSPALKRALLGIS